MPADDAPAGSIPDAVPGVLDGTPLDPESAQWLADLTGDGPTRARALEQLHRLLLRIARAELRRRAGQHPVTGPELDDLAHQAADDALVAVIGKLDRFRGESRSRPGPTGSSSSRSRPSSAAISGSVRRSRWRPRTGTGCPTGSG